MSPYKILAFFENMGLPSIKSTIWFIGGMGGEGGGKFNNVHVHLSNMKMYKEKELAQSAEIFANFILQIQLKMGRKATKSTKNLINLTR